MHRFLKNCNYFFVVTVITLCQQLHAGCDYPSIIWVPVTYYDFHSDRSNPEFEQRHQGMVRQNMVASTLDNDNKPTLGSAPYMNYGIKKWFRPWVSGDFSVPSYTPKAGFKEFFGGDTWVKEYKETITYQGMVTTNTDTAFKNIVIRDSLPFSHIGGGVYEYRNDAFFPLDNKGFGNEWNQELQNTTQPLNVHHNYSFTMELHHDFIKKPNMTFHFKGDDDVWVFVNNKLQIDIGGIHEAAEGSTSLDDIGGLTNGKMYSLSVFYAERHSAESHILITTNIIQPHNKLRLYSQAGTPDVGANQPIGFFDTAVAGVPLQLYAHVFDSSGTQWLSASDAQVSWQIIDTMGNPGFSDKNGGADSLFPIRANGMVTVVAKFTDPQCPEFVTIATLNLFVKPGPAHHVNIMGDSIVSYLYQDDPFQELIIPSTNNKRTVYAVIRDSLGNYIGRADGASWKSLDIQSAIVTGSGWKAVVTRVGGGDSNIVAEQTSLIADSVRVITPGIENSAASPNPFTPGKTVLENVLPFATLQFYGNVMTAGGTKGILIALGTKRPLKGKIRAVIFDVVGNIVQDNLEVKPARQGAATKYGVVWDGANKKGRFVGPGAYLAVIEGIYEDSSPFYRKIKIGVVR